MKTSRLLRLILSLIVIGLALGCAADTAMQKKKSKDTRRIGEAYLAEGDFTSALRSFLKAEEIYPNDPFLHNDLGLTYQAKGELDLAIRHFKKAVELNPDYAPARNNLGVAYLAKQDWDSAIGIFKELTGNLLYTTPHYPLANLGWAYYNKGAYRLAEKYYRRALSIEPKFIIAMRGLGLTCLATGRVNEAIQMFEKASRLSPNLAELHMNLAEAYRTSGETEKSIAAYKKVIELAEDNEIAWKAEQTLKQLSP